mmetsp:Transcript_51412/g.135643  ORF Transcript_51412/g.135643 Transcript_51412/m.135643 type:complete len:216 (-) Transcript_51412:730-1377(-)
MQFTLTTPVCTRSAGPRSDCLVWKKPVRDRMDRVSLGNPSILFCFHSCFMSKSLYKMRYGSGSSWLTLSMALSKALDNLPSDPSGFLVFRRFTSSSGTPYRPRRFPKWLRVAVRFTSLNSKSTAGFGFVAETSCDQKSGTEARSCTYDIASPVCKLRVATLQTICSTSTSLAQSPRVFNPRLRNLVPAKNRDLRATIAMSKFHPNEEQRVQATQP